MLKFIAILILMFTYKLGAAPRALNHSFMLTKGRETLAAVGFTQPAVSMGKLKQILKSCSDNNYELLPVAYAVMNEAQQSTFTSKGLAKRVANIYRALRAIDRDSGEDYAHDFLELAVENDKLDLDLLYRYSYWLSIVDFILPPHDKYAPPQDGLAVKDFKLHFYEQSNAKPITEKSTNIAGMRDFYKFFSVKKNTKTIIEKGFLDNFGHLANRARRHYSLPPEEEEVFNALVESLQTYSDKNKQRQYGKLSSSDAAARRDALSSILAKDPDESLVRHEATLSGFATQDFVQGRKPLRMRTLSRLYSLVEKFRDDAATYQELRWHYLRVYRHSLNLSPKQTKAIELAEDDLPASSPSSKKEDSYQIQLVTDADLYLSGASGLLTESQIQDLRGSPPDQQSEPQTKQKSNKARSRTISVRDHPRFDQIKRHSYFEHIIDAVVDARLKNYGSSYSSAREYTIRNGQSTFGISAKERNTYIYEGSISQESIDKLKAALTNIMLDAEQAEALENITQPQPDSKTSGGAANFTTTTIKLIEKAIGISNQVYSEKDNKIALLRLVKIWSDLRREVTVGTIEKETVVKAREAVSDMKQKITDDDAKILEQLLEKLEAFQ